MGEAVTIPHWLAHGEWTRDIIATVYNDVIHILHVPSNDFWKHRVHHGVHTVHTAYTPQVPQKLGLP